MGRRIILVTGGTRSGKSAFAQRSAEEAVGEKLYIATCPPDRGDDPEMAARISRHKDDRLGRGWQTVEEPLDLCGGLRAGKDTPLILVDCLTLWVSNLMFHYDNAGKGAFGEDEMALLAKALLREAGGQSGTLWLVTNEVGLGVVPENPLARRYRDLVGRCNQVVAAGAHELWQVVCGIPHRIK